MNTCEACNIELTIVNNQHEGDPDLCESCHNEAKQCDLCGDGEMTWCTCCKVYSSNCCCDYGTCACS